MSTKKSNRFWFIGLSIAVLCFAVGFAFLGAQNTTSADVAEPAQQTQPAPQAQQQGSGPLELYGLKVGQMEDEIGKNNLTFVIDEKRSSPPGLQPTSHVLVSRFRDSLGGQYVARCKGGMNYRLDVAYQQPITATKAKVILKNLIPVSDHFTQVTSIPGHVEESQAPSRGYMFGKRYAGMLFYSNMAEGRVYSISAFDLETERTKIE